MSVSKFIFDYPLVLKYLVHVGSLDKVQERQVQELSRGREIKDGSSPGYYSYAPDACHSKDALRAVEEAVYARISQILWRRLEEEIAIEPAKAA